MLGGGTNSFVGTPNPSHYKTQRSTGSKGMYTKGGDFYKRDAYSNEGVYSRHATYIMQKMRGFISQKFGWFVGLFIYYTPRTHAERRYKSTKYINRNITVVCWSVSNL